MIIVKLLGSFSLYSALPSGRIHVSAITNRKTLTTSKRFEIDGRICCTQTENHGQPIGWWRQIGPEALPSGWNYFRSIFKCENRQKVVNGERYRRETTTEHWTGKWYLTIDCWHQITSKRVIMLTHPLSCTSLLPTIKQINFPWLHTDVENSQQLR